SGRRGRGGERLRSPGRPGRREQDAGTGDEGHGEQEREPPSSRAHHTPPSRFASRSTTRSASASRSSPPAAATVAAAGLWTSFCTSAGGVLGGGRGADPGHRLRPPGPAAPGAVGGVLVVPGGELRRSAPLTACAPRPDGGEVRGVVLAGDRARLDVGPRGDDDRIPPPDAEAAAALLH